MIQLYSKNSNVLLIELLDILSQIHNIEQYNWKVLWFDGISKNNDLDIPKLEQEIDNSQNGLALTSSELINFSESLCQIIEIVLIGDKDKNKLEKSNDEVLKERCEFFFELVDSSYWEITSKNKLFMENIRRIYPWCI